MNKANGTFYCADSLLYANGTGEYMEQGDALNIGYQPSLGTYCHGGQAVARAKQRQTPRSNNNGSGGEEPGGAKSDFSAPPPR
ncbi:MAG TPA: hypothetical protein VGS20_11905 [Candidatus Acidoferrales bacterium]|nr:hypothetical protein [Candidatus Acidoferrales bacterium]